MTINVPATIPVQMRIISPTTLYKSFIQYPEDMLTKHQTFYSLLKFAWYHNEILEVLGEI